MVVRLSRGRYPPALHAEFTARMAAAATTLVPAVRRLPGCLGYYAATDEASSTMVNVSLWASVEEARAMATLPEMAALATEFIALGAEFERPIVDYTVLWQLP